MSDVSIPSSPQPQIAPVPGEPLTVPDGQIEAPTAQLQTAAPQSGDACASCGAAMAGDQRYCLQCGARRGDPRLPFMDAVVLMDAVRQPKAAPPAPPKKKRGGISPNAALITGIGTLLLALGIGVLIGRSGNHEVAQTAAAPQVIKVGGGGGAETASTGAKSKGAETVGGGKGSKSKGKEGSQAAEKQGEEAVEQVLKPSGNVDLPPATVKPGDKCKSGEAGCEGGEFTGNFFGE